MSKTNWKKMAFGMTTALIASLLIACGNDDAGTDSDADTGTDAGTEETDGGESAAGEPWPCVYADRCIHSGHCNAGSVY